MLCADSGSRYCSEDPLLWEGDQEPSWTQPIQRLPAYSSGDRGLDERLRQVCFCSVWAWVPVHRSLCTVQQSDVSVLCVSVGYPPAYISSITSVSCGRRKGNRRRCSTWTAGVTVPHCNRLPALRRRTWGPAVTPVFVSISPSPRHTSWMLILQPPLAFIRKYLEHLNRHVFLYSWNLSSNYFWKVKSRRCWCRTTGTERGLGGERPAAAGDAVVYSCWGEPPSADLTSCCLLYWHLISCRRRKESVSAQLPLCLSLPFTVVAVCVCVCVGQYRGADGMLFPAVWWVSHLLGCCLAPGLLA